MNILLTTVGRRGYIVEYFKNELPEGSIIVGTSDRHSSDIQYTSGLLKCDYYELTPSIKDEVEYIQKLKEVCSKYKIECMLSLYDYDAYILSKYLDEFIAIGVKPIIADKIVNKHCFDKFETYNFLKRNKIPSPKTYASLESFLADENYPVIVKPRNGFGSEDLYIASSRNEVDFFLELHIKQHDYTVFYQRTRIWLRYI